MSFTGFNLSTNMSQRGIIFVSGAPYVNLSII